MWLLEKSVAEWLERKKADGPLIPADASARFDAMCQAESAMAARGEPRILHREGSTAHIRVEGILTKNRDLFAWFLYGANTSYREFQQALAVVEADQGVTDVLYHFDTPGGAVDGLFDALAAMEACSKPQRAVAEQACSAGYAMASMAGQITAVNAAARFGSVGVVASYRSDAELINITSTQAPNKRPDLTTDEGRAVVRRELDAIHELFVDAIARGRATNPQTVNSRFGRGAVVLAKEAKELNMIDSIAQSPSGARRPQAVSSGPEPQGTQDMDENQLKTEHPKLYMAIFDQGKVAGEAAERERVEAHLIMAESTGAVKLAHDAIRSGKSVMNQVVHAQYLAASRNRSDVAARDEDTETVAAVTGGAKTSVDEKDLGDEVVAILEGNQQAVK